jgi:uroporphyrinogen-III synthase
MPRTYTVLTLGPDPPRPSGYGRCLAVWLPLVQVSLSGELGKLPDLLDEGVEAIVVTSPRAARALAALPPNLRHKLASLAVVAVGPATAREVRRLLGVEALTPSDYTVASVAELIRSRGWRRVVALRSSEAIGSLRPLTPRNVDLIELKAYEVHVSSHLVQDLELLASRVDSVAVTSSIIARVVCSLLERLESRPILACFHGPTLSTVYRLCPNGTRIVVSSRNTYSDLIRSVCTALNYMEQGI